MTHWEKVYSDLQLTNKQFTVRTTTVTLLIDEIFALLLCKLL